MKPRSERISADELSRLPVDAVVLDSAERAWQKGADGLWRCTGSDGHESSATLTRDWTIRRILYAPEQSPGESVNALVRTFTNVGDREAEVAVAVSATRETTVGQLLGYLEDGTRYVSVIEIRAVAW